MAANEKLKESDLIQQEKDDDNTNNDDMIQGTVFSKSWILSLLVKLVSTVDDEKEEGGDMGGAKGGVPLEEVQIEEIAKSELDEKIENELCILWDVTVTAEVSIFLHQHHALELITGVAMRSPYNRLTEICLGIMNNMACHESICQEAFTSHSLITSLVFLLCHQDTPTLIELTRLIVTCLSHDQVCQYWLEEFKTSDTALPDLVFILNSSTNCDLLRQVAILMDSVLDKCQALLIEWAQSMELVQGLCEAMKQCNASGDQHDVMCTLMMCLQSLSTIEEGVDSILKSSDQVYQEIFNLLKIFSHFYDSEESLTTESDSGLMAVLSLSHFILDNKPTESKILKDLLTSEQTIIKYLHHLVDKHKLYNNSQNIKELAEKLLSILLL